MEFSLSTQIPASPETIFKAWLSDKGHSQMTGGAARCSDVEGQSYTAWDGYIKGRNLILEPFTRIVQSWRTVEFSEDEADSRLEILLKAEGTGTKLTLIHTEVPPHGKQYIQGWEDNYFQPMKDYFSN